MKTRVRFFKYFILAFFVICQTETSGANEFIAMGLAEQHADKNAHDDMSAYQKSMYCTISDKNPRVNYNQTVTLPTDEYMR